MTETKKTIPDSPEGGGKLDTGKQPLEEGQAKFTSISDSVQTGAIGRLPSNDDNYNKLNKPLITDSDWMECLISNRTPVSFNIFTNVRKPDAPDTPILSIIDCSSPVLGKLNYDHNGYCHYTPFRDCIGKESLIFTLFDGENISKHTVTIHIESKNDEPSILEKPANLPPPHPHPC